MSNSIYQLLMRWCYQGLSPLVSAHLHPLQFGGRQDVSTMHATQIFINDLENREKWEAIFALDMYAFDSPPKIVICEALDRLGTPATH